MNMSQRINTYRLGHYNDDYVYIRNRLLSDDKLQKKLREIKDNSSMTNILMKINQNKKRIVNNPLKHGEVIGKSSTNSTQFGRSTLRVSIKNFNLPTLQKVNEPNLATVRNNFQHSYSKSNTNFKVPYKKICNNSPFNTMNNSYSNINIKFNRSGLLSREKDREVKEENVRFKSRINRVNSPLRKENLMKDFDFQKKISIRVRKIRPLDQVMKRVFSVKNHFNL